MTIIIEIKGLSKSYGKIQALKDVDLEIRDGEVHGVFGANGAGKSTLIKVLAGVTRPDSGLVEVKGLQVTDKPHEVRAICTPIEEIPMMYRTMKLYELLSMYCESIGMTRDTMDERMCEALYTTDIGDIIEKKFGNMSLGQQHRSEVARAIATGRDILLMDEPFIGIDIETKKRLKDHFKEWVKAKKGRAIIFTSHNLLENEDFVDHLTFLSQGAVRDTDTVEAIRARYLKTGFAIVVDDLEKAVLIVQDIEGIKIDKVEGKTLHVLLKDEELMKPMMKELALNDVGVVESRRIGSMEDVFTELSGVRR